MADNIDFWAMLIGICVTAAVSGVLYWLIELPQARQHARYRRAQQNWGSGFGHNGANTDA